MDDFARYKDLPKYVVSTTLTDDEMVRDWGTIAILRSLGDVAALKASDGGLIIVHGGVFLTHALTGIQKNVFDVTH